MKTSLRPLAELLSRHRDDIEDDEARVGETPAELLRRLGLRSAEQLPEFKSSLPPLATSTSTDEISRWTARFIRHHLLPRFLGGGYTQLELDALAGPEGTTVGVNQEENRRLKEQILSRLTGFTDRWDPQPDEKQLARVDHIERLRERLGDHPSGPKGLRP